jgi:hypothetical protein
MSVQDTPEPNKFCPNPMNESKKEDYGTILDIPANDVNIEPVLMNRRRKRSPSDKSGKTPITIPRPPSAQMSSYSVKKSKSSLFSET